MNSTAAESFGSTIAIGGGITAPAGSDGVTLALVTANSLGGASLLPGSLEVMVNRAVVDSSGNRNTGNRYAQQVSEVQVFDGGDSNNEVRQVGSVVF